METYMVEPQTNFRYERKFIIPFNKLELFIKSLYNEGFYSLHEQRKVNNLYLDNYDFSSLTQNIDGLSQRKKYRVRWYGSTFKNSLKIFEVKIKDEFLNKKTKLALGNIKLLDIDKIDIFYHSIKKSIWNEGNYKFFNYVNSKIPTLLNSYDRFYFSNLDKSVRITLDKNLKFTSPITKLKFNETNVIIEVKYNSKDYFNNNLKNLSFTRYSKYVQGTSKTTFFNSSY